jgi:hypothetical protein
LSEEIGAVVFMADLDQGHRARVRHESGLLPFRLRIMLWFISEERLLGSCLSIEYFF